MARGNDQADGSSNEFGLIYHPEPIEEAQGQKGSRREDLLLNMGPQHPSTHGVLRVVLDLDGEKIMKATPHLGYLHRGVEKLAENKTYYHIITLTDRLDYVCAMTNNYAYVRAVEKLLQIEIPELKVSDVNQICVLIYCNSTSSAFNLN